MNDGEVGTWRLFQYGPWGSIFSLSDLIKNILLAAGPKVILRGNLRRVFRVLMLAEWTTIRIFWFPVGTDGLQRRSKVGCSVGAISFIHAPSLNMDEFLNS